MGAFVADSIVDDSHNLVVGYTHCHLKLGFEDQKSYRITALMSGMLQNIE